jgi:phage gp46-like protein
LPFTRPGSDMAMTKQDPSTGLYNFDWSNGDPLFDDTQAHRCLSLLIEHRPTPEKPGYWADETGKRGSYLYTLRNITNATPSQAEAYAADAMQKAVDDNAITFRREDVTARRIGRTGLSLVVKYKANGRVQTVRTSVGT